MDQKFRRVLAALSKSGTKKNKGDAGERFAREWFGYHEFEYLKIPQTPDTMPNSLAGMGGKRPDYALELEPGSSLLYIDAKFHQTNGVTEFALTEDELKQFVAFRSWAAQEFEDGGERDLLLMLYPQELNGDRFVFIHLDELLAGQSTTIEGQPAKKVSLLGRDESWFDSPP